MRLHSLQIDSCRLRSRRRWNVPLCCFLLATGLASVLAGCDRFRPVQHEYVYVSAREVYLRDRVAAVSNRVALVKNGQRLEVIEHGRRFDKVRTDDGKIGWLQEHTIIDQKAFDQYAQLAAAHAADPVLATAQLRDDLNLHLTPGRNTDHFYLLPGSSHVRLLVRASIPHVVPGAVPSAVHSEPAAAGAKSAENAKTAVAPVPMEDWWLVRDDKGDTGWLLGSRMDVDIPDAIGEYAEGQRMMAAYPLATVIDDGHEGRREVHSGPGRTGRRVRHAAAQDADADSANSTGAAESTRPSGPADQPPTAPARETEYLVLLAPNASGLPYDFDQVRVFTWSLNHHRYETAYRLRGFQGFFPVTMTQETVNGVAEPAFSFRIAGAAGSILDPQTGIAHPVAPRTVSFRLEGNIIRRTGADQAPIETHVEDGVKKPHRAVAHKRR